MEVEIIGIVAAIFILVSLTFKCVTVKRNIIMRALNAFGSLAFVAYGAVILYNGGFGWSLVVCNSLLCAFDIYHIVKLCISLKKDSAEDAAVAINQNDETVKENKTLE